MKQLKRAALASVVALLLIACQPGSPEPAQEAASPERAQSDALQVRTSGELESVLSDGNWSATVQLEPMGGQPPFIYETTWPRLGSGEPATFSVSGSNCEPVMFTATVRSSDALERKIGIGIGHVSCEGAVAASPESVPGATPPAPSETTAPATTGTPPATVPSQSLDAATQELLRLINDARRQSNTPEFAYNEKLAQAALRHSQSMATTGQISHQVTGEPSLEQRVREAGYTGGSTENIYAGGTNPADALNWWLTDQTDPSHRTNILGTEFQEIGIGIVKGPALTYYTLVFGRP